MKLTTGVGEGGTNINFSSFIHMSNYTSLGAEVTSLPKLRNIFPFSHIFTGKLTKKKESEANISFFHNIANSSEWDTTDTTTYPENNSEWVTSHLTHPPMTPVGLRIVGLLESAKHIE